MTHEEWLETRRNYIGASECAVVMGFSPWKSAVELHYEKTGEIEPDDISGSDAIRMGIELEPIIAKLFREKHRDGSLRTYGADKPYLFTSRDYEFMSCSPDGIFERILVPNDGCECVEHTGVEFKTTSEYNKADWADGNVPYHYQLQCQHSMAVTGFYQWYIACLIGGRTYVEAIVERDDALIQIITETEQAFWDGVQAKTPPNWDGSSSAWTAIKKLHAALDDNIIDLTESDDVADLLSCYEGTAREIKKLKEEIEALTVKQDSYKQELICCLGGSSRGVFGDEVIEYKTVERKEHVVKASNYQKFGIRKRKKGE